MLDEVDLSFAKLPPAVKYPSLRGRRRLQRHVTEAVTIIESAPGGGGAEHFPHDRGVALSGGARCASPCDQLPF